VKKAFLVQGPDRPGAVHGHFRKLAAAGVSVTAASAVTTGDKRYGMIVWVKPRDYNRAAKALAAR
jgi:predicted amino acid-binding ACT domain protein